MRCPQCNITLNEISIEFRKVESWYECQTCLRRFEEPKIIHNCLNCGIRFSIREMELIPAYSLTLTEGAKTESKRGFILLNSVKTKLERLGYLVEIPGIIKGSTGTIHIFNLVASRSVDRKSKNKSNIVIDAVISKDKLDERIVTNTFTKILDVEPLESILIVIPELSKTARKLAELYKIKTIEVTDMDKATKILEKYLKK